MKKIQPIKIIVAVVTALVFCIALAVPCFADSPTEGTDYVINTITFTDGDTAYQWFMENSTKVEKVIGTIIGVDPPVSVVFDSFLPVHNGDIITSFTGSSFILSDIVQDKDTGITSITAIAAMFKIDSITTSFLPPYASIIFQDSLSPSVDAALMVDLPNSAWSTYGLTITVEYTTEYVPKENATRSGMFGQLYNILRDAIFGKDVSLDDSQDFVLTQISTWMTYIIILLPILVVGVILFRIFCR